MANEPASLDRIAADITRAAEAGDTGALTAYLDDRAPALQGRASGDAELIRGFALAALARGAMPEAGAAAAVEDLETSLSPYTAAAAGLLAQALPAPGPDWPERLAAAAQRIAGADRKVWFDRIGQAPRPDIDTTALDILGAAFAATARAAGMCGHRTEALIAAAPPRFARAARTAAKAPPAACCGSAATATPPAGSRRGEGLAAAVWTAPLQDQDGRATSLADLASGRPTLLAFFYTRCMNPVKCARTVTLLGRVAAARADAAAPPAVLGLSYDPAWDTPARLHRYGRDRGMAYTPFTRLLRATGDWQALRAALGLSVGYGPTTVNRHRLEMLVLAADGRIAFDTAGRPAEAETLLAHLDAAASQPAGA